MRGDGVETGWSTRSRATSLPPFGKGLDLKAALDFARRQGQAALRAMSYAERAKLVGAVADVLAANRARYEAIAIANSGNTRSMRRSTSTAALAR